VSFDDTFFVHKTSCIVLSAGTALDSFCIWTFSFFAQTSSANVIICKKAFDVNNNQTAPFFCPPAKLFHRSGAV